jgi:hypothetical protein
MIAKLRTVTGTPIHKLFVTLGVAQNSPLT